MSKKSGFTLIELSIVLVIISLITAGIVSGREMIHTSRLTSIANDFVKYETAYNMFIAKYDAIPGDFDEASDYWPGQTEEGDGNNELDSAGEVVQFWDHLALAGLIEGNYDETITTATGYFGGVNMPRSSLDSANFYANAVPIRYLFTLDVSAVNDRYQNILGLANEGAFGASTYKILTPEDAKFIDKKLDNAMPGTGKVIGFSATKTCANNHTLATMTTDTYDVSNTSKTCAPFYIISN